MFKYLFLANVYKKTRRRVMFLVVTLVMLIMTTLLFNDLIGATSGLIKYLFILTKWSLVVTYLWIIVHNLKKIWKVARSTMPLPSRVSDPLNPKKEILMAKVTLQSRSDLIINKYKERSE